MIWRGFHPSANTMVLAGAVFGLILRAVLLDLFDPQATAKDIMLVIIGALAPS